MSDDSGHRRHGSRGGAGRWVSIGGWVVAALLGAHFVWGMIRSGAGGGSGGGGSLLPERAYFAIAFWTPFAVLVASSAAGFLWSMKAYSRREKSSLLWMRHAFTFGLIAALLLAVATFQNPGSFRREWYAASVAAIAAAQMVLFASAAFREQRRSSGHGGRRSSSSVRRDDPDDDGDDE